MTITLRHGDYRSVLVDAEQVDAVISDTPYSARVHQGHNEAKRQRCDATGQSVHQEIEYSHFTPNDVFEFVQFWSMRNRGWFAIMSCSELAHVWRAAFEAYGLLAFCPVNVRSFTPRLLGDGPSQGLLYLNVARPRSAEFLRWGSFFAGYGHHRERGAMAGGKSKQLMRRIISDYTKPGDKVCDPCAGYATTLLAAREIGCHAIGAEIDRGNYEVGMSRIARPYQSLQHQRTIPEHGPRQGSLLE